MVVEEGALTVLFDLDLNLDLTLLEIPGDREIRGRAIDRATSVPGVLDLIDDRGRTDRWLIDEVIRRGVSAPERLWERYEAEYTGELRAALTSVPSSALAGAADLLTALRETNTVLGVSTGNLRANAVQKLAHAGLAPFFEPLRGGFGDLHADRGDIVRMGAAACGHSEGGRLVVVGDTIYDVRAALDAGAVPIAVATGHATPEELRAAGASVVLDGLADLSAALAAVQSH